MKSKCDILVVGGGVIGAAVARDLAGRDNYSVTLLEKEKLPGMHASGRNSGVKHAGFYYSPGSKKADFCRLGSQELGEYCKERRIPMKVSGKVVVAQNERDLKTLDELERRASSNGVEVKIIGPLELADYELFARTYERALYSPHTAVVDGTAVVRSLLEDAQREGVDIRYMTRMRGVDVDNRVVATNRGSIEFEHLVNCGGAFADRIAHKFGVGERFTIIPFRGDYYRLSPQKGYAVRSMIYPVPDIRNPFLGIHFTRTVHGDVIVGPNAVPVLGREHYGMLKGIRPIEALRILALEMKLLATKEEFRDMAWDEIMRMTRKLYAKQAKRMLPSVEHYDLESGVKSGIRAQLFDRLDGELVQDFVVESGPASTHILNAVSPGLTCSIPFARHIGDIVSDEI